MISFKHKGDFSRTLSFLRKSPFENFKADLDAFGQMGVSALSMATPYDTGETANSWFYTIEDSGSSIKIVWENSVLIEGVPLAILLQYGHGTRNGGYVTGIDYINPALQPVFEQIAADAWNAITNS